MISEIKDINLIKDLFNKYKDNYDPIINNYTHILVYKIDNKYVGFLIYQLLYDAIDIIDIFVLEEYRNKKIATKLINNMLENKNNIKVSLEVRIDNNNAINLYNSLGFKKVAIRKGYYKGVDAYLMLKEVK